MTEDVLENTAGVKIGVNTFEVLRSRSAVDFDAEFAWFRLET